MFTVKYTSSGRRVDESPTFATIESAWDYIIHVRCCLGGMYV